MYPTIEPMWRVARATPGADVYEALRDAKAEGYEYLWHNNRFWNVKTATVVSTGPWKEDNQ